MPSTGLVSRKPTNRLSALELLKTSENNMNVRSGRFFTAVDRTLSANCPIFHSIYRRTPLIRINRAGKSSGKAENPENWISH
jgi:hypothetical protein